MLRPGAPKHYLSHDMGSILTEQNVRPRLAEHDGLAGFYAKLKFPVANMRVRKVVLPWRKHCPPPEGTADTRAHGLCVLRMDLQAAYLA